MYRDHVVVCVIHARGGSKGLPGKNIKMFCGKPLIAHTIEQARQSKYIDRVIVSTEAEEIARISLEYGAEVPFIRPMELAGDSVATIDVLLQAINWFEKGVAYEENHARYTVLEKKAEYFSELGRRSDAVKIYETLLKQPFITEAEKERLRKTVQIVLGKSVSGWQ